MPKIKKGDLVVVSHWSDFDFPSDEVRLGRFERFADGYFYIEGIQRGYMNCRTVNPVNVQYAQHNVQRIGLLARISKWFGAIANR